MVSTSTISTIIVSAIIVLIAALAIRSIYRDHRNGIGACGEKCSDCSLHCDSTEIPERFRRKEKK